MLASGMFNGKSARFNPSFIVYCQSRQSVFGCSKRVLRIRFDGKISCSTFSREVLLGYTGLSDIALFCRLDFMSCSMDLDVMPHSATSRATGDDISTIVDSNSGVRSIHPVMWMYMLRHVSQ